MLTNKKIAFISTMDSSPWGGSEELWALAANHALDAGHEVAAFVFRWPSTPARLTALERKGGRVFRRPLYYPRVVGRAMRRLSPPFKDLLAFKPDVICINQGATYDAIYNPDLPAAVDASSAPYVVVCHLSIPNHFPSGGAREAASALYDRAARVVFVSQDNLRNTQRQLARDIPNAVILRNPVNLRDLSAVPWPASQTACLANVARLGIEFKGQDALLEALGAPAWRDRDWRLRLYGDGPDRGYLESLARYYEIAGRVDFAGHVADIRALWADNHLLVMPSRAEGIPLALVEAMLCGRPAVVTDVGGHTEWIEDGRTGFVAAVPTAASIGAALERAFAAQMEWVHMGAEAHASALEKYDETPGKTFLDLLLAIAR